MAGEAMVASRLAATVVTAILRCDVSLFVPLRFGFGPLLGIELYVPGWNRV